MICKNFYFQIMSFVIFMSSKKYLCTYFKVSHSKSHPDHHHDFLLGLLTNLNIYLVFFFHLLRSWYRNRNMICTLVLKILIFIILSTHLLSHKENCICASTLNIHDGGTALFIIIRTLLPSCSTLHPYSQE